MQSWCLTGVHGGMLLPGLVVLAGLVSPSPGAWQQRPLTFEDRVRAQEAIERVYYSHQIGATRPFEQAVPRVVLEMKVRTYLKQSAALERFWNTPVTGAMLRAEAERMARRTRMPGRLREIFAVLGEDPVLVQECLARPALVGRLAGNFFAYDERIHAEAKRAAESVHAELLSGRLDPHAEHPNRTLTRRESKAAEGETVRPPTTVGLPARPGDIGSIHEERDRFVTQVLLEQEPSDARVATYVFPKRAWEEWWGEVEPRLNEDSVETVAFRAGALPRHGTDAHGLAASAQFDLDSIPTDHAIVPASACASDDTWENGSLDDFPDRRFSHTAVWTGSVMVVWGGLISSSFTGHVPLPTGGRYDPATDTWTSMSTVNAPEGRSGHTSVWTGSRMLVWGGFGATGSIRTGGRYDPVADAWEPMSTTGAPPVRFGHTVVWTGSLMVIWGGQGTSTGGRYDPDTDTWTPTSTVNAPAARDKHTAVWTGDLMVVWGGDGEAFGDASFLATGGRYDPVTDTWTATSMTNVPLRRQDHTSVWTGSRMIVWGGLTSVSGQLIWLDTGGLYDPATDAWTPTSTTGSPSRRRLHSAVWTDDLMLIWGGGPDPSGNASHVQTGGRYDPATDTWMPMSTTNAPSGRGSLSVVWTGSQMIIWGGKVDTFLAEVILHFDTGGRYDPQTDTWTPTSRGDAPGPRSQHTAVWTGTTMVVWGGQFYDTAFDEYHPIGDGGRYDPATDTWTPTSATNAPAARSWHTAVWSGQEMVVWGGVGTQLLDDGGRYDPMSDAWTPTGNVGAPTPRFAHTGVWTGTQLIVWGGQGVSSYLDSGGRYDPAADTWAPLSENNSPVGRYRHTAVWTGSEMIVWGGLDGQGVSATGGRYDPTTDAWVATSLSGSPSGRLNHTAVWTGSNMIIWAGFDGADELTGGAYHPPTDMWTPLSTTDAPTNGQGHTAIWTGRHMVVWGGSQRGTFTLLNTGSRYDPASDTWTRTTADNAPMGRVGHVAVWSGEFMIVWGGEDALSTKTGGAYCACVPTLHYRDADGDGRGDPEAFVQSCSQPEGHVTDGNDCDDGAADVWAAPGEVRDLLFVDGVTLGWKTPADPGATLIGYDVIRSDDPADFMSGAVCIATDVMTVTAADASSPVQGKALFYLVRAETGCPDGQGTLGTDSSGTPRSGRSCP